MARSSSEAKGMTDRPVVERIRDDILRGHLVPGSRLVELQLSEHYQVGRAAIRSALTTLAGEGLVIIKANRGATVRHITIREAIQITEARAVLESLVAGLAAVRADDADRIELCQIIADMRAAVAADDGHRYSQLNGDLHLRIRAIADHPVAAELIANLSNRAAHHRYRLALVPGRSHQSIEQHADIVEAIAAGDRDRAAAAMAAHLASVIEVLQRWGQVQQGASAPIS